MDNWNSLVWFEGEDETALKDEFVQLCAKHKNNFSGVEVARYLFRNLKDPETRAFQAAAVWGRDLDVQEAIRVAVLTGPSLSEVSKPDIERRALQLIDDPGTEPKDKIAAMRLLAEMGGMIVKQSKVEADLSKSAGLPIFNIVKYGDE